MLTIGTMSICFEYSREQFKIYEYEYLYSYSYILNLYQLTIGVFSIAFAMSVIEKVGGIPEYADDAI